MTDKKSILNFHNRNMNVRTKKKKTKKTKHRGNFDINHRGRRRQTAFM